AGGHPVVVMAPEACTELLLRHGGPEQLAFLNPLELREVETVDVAIHVLAPQNTRVLSGVEPARPAARSQARRPLMDLFLHRTADQALRWVVTQLPCQAAAQDAGMSLAEYEDFVYRACLLHHDDPAAAWRARAAWQARLVEALRPVRELR